MVRTELREVHEVSVPEISKDGEIEHTRNTAQLGLPGRVQYRDL